MITQNSVYLCTYYELRVYFFVKELTLKKKKKRSLSLLLLIVIRASVVLKPGTPRYQDGIFQDGGYNVTKKFVYMAAAWSPCSVTCGSGHQKRRVTCTRVTNK